MSEQSLALINPQDLITKAIEQKVDTDQLEKLFALAKDVVAFQAKQAFYRAMAEFKAECPQIYKRRKANLGSFSYKFADLGDEDEVISPAMSKAGLSYRWVAPRLAEGKVVIECIVQHALGHTESSGEVEMDIPAPQYKTVNNERVEIGANIMQRRKIALSYARRTSVEIALGLAPAREDDTDGDIGRDAEAGQDQQQPSTGRTITEPMVKRLWAIARGQVWTTDDVHALLKKNGIESGDPKDIPIGGRKYDELCDAIKLEKKAAPSSSRDAGQPTS